MNAKTIVHMLVILVSLSTTATEIARSSNIDPVTMGSIVIISGGKGSGTGFLASLSSTNYLVTNEHVLRCGPPFRAQLISGETILLDKKIRISQSSDVALIRLEDQFRDTLTISTTLPRIGDPIVVVGNAGGHGVLNRLDGLIAGVGPNQIEITAPIIPGCSGSPVMHTDGTVAGIATYGVIDISTRELRDTKATERKFAYRVSESDFITVDPSRYLAVAYGLQDLDTFCSELKSIITTTIKGDGYDLSLGKKKYNSSTRLAELLNHYSMALEKIRDIELRAASLAVRYGNDPSKVPEATWNALFAQFGNRTISSYQNDLINARRALLSEPTEWIEKNNWLVERLKSEALAYRDYIQSLMEILPGKNGHVRIE